MTIPSDSFDSYLNKIKMREKNGSIEISFTYKGKRKYLGGGAYTPINVTNAQIKMRQIALDLFSGNFDETLNKYRTSEALVKQEKKQEIITPSKLWRQFIEQLAFQTKVTTQTYNEGFMALFDKVGDIPIQKSEEVKAALLRITTVSQTKRALAKLSAACKWGVKKEILERDYYDGMASELPKFRYQLDAKPNAFSAEQRAAVIAAFQNDQRKGISFSKYAPLVEFWFLTGCRPSEGIGLQWKNVSEDCTQVFFKGSITQVGGKAPVRVAYSKNNKSRTFPCGARLTELLKSIKPSEFDPEALVFPSTRGDGPVNYNNFCRRAWTKLVDPIKKDTTPYSCRDTFITLQLLEGVSSYFISIWCDTSIKMIETHYADYLQMSHIRPVDIP